MKRRLQIVVMAAVMVLGMAMAGTVGSGAVAQDATPAPPGVIEIAPGVTADSVVFVPGRENPLLYRLNFEPGVTYPIQPAQSLELVYVEVGHLTVELDTPVTVSQLGTEDTAGETYAAGMEFTVSVGEYFVLPPNASGVVRNEGLDTATVSVAGIPADISALPVATPEG